jgi:hypothetical protein
VTGILHFYSLQKRNILKFLFFVQVEDPETLLQRQQIQQVTLSVNRFVFVPLAYFPPLSLTKKNTSLKTGISVEKNSLTLTTG